LSRERGILKNEPFQTRAAAGGVMAFELMPQTSHSAIISAVSVPTGIAQRKAFHEKSLSQKGEKG
jgi:hypothetical protein